MIRRLGLIVAGLITGCSAGGSQGEADFHRVPILFVHGHGDLADSTWGTMIAALVQAGWPPEYLLAPQLLPRDGPNIAAAERIIAPGVERLLAEAGAVAEANGAPSPRKIDMVTHSMGALSGRWYATKIAPERVRRWISLAGANHGTDALCGWQDPASREACPAFATRSVESEIQVGLNGTPEAPQDETPYGVGIDPPEVASVPPDSLRSIAYLTARVGARGFLFHRDIWITPPESALLSGAGGLRFTMPANLPAVEDQPGNYSLTGTDHDALPRDPRVIRLIRLVLLAETT